MVKYKTDENNQMGLLYDVEQGGASLDGQLTKVNNRSYFVPELLKRRKEKENED